MSQYVIPTLPNPFNVRMALPGSKSIALRQLAIAALCQGKTRIKGLPPCDDIDAMLDCLSKLGVAIDGDYAEMTVSGPMNFHGDIKLDARMSGASTRLLIGLASLRHGRTTIDGHPSLRVRTNTPLFDVLRTHGCRVDSNDGTLPAVIHGNLNAPDTIQIDGSLSSQYITALMVIAPLSGSDSLRIEITGELVSRPYLNITANEMKKRGCPVTWANPTTLLIHAGQYSGGEITVEGDATAATYFAGLATLHNSHIEVSNLGNASEQGDYEFFSIMEALGAKVTRSTTQTKIQGPKTLSALPEIDMTAMPDAALTLLAMGPLLAGGIKITGLSSLHHKECDRLECPAREFAALGVDCETTYESISFQPHRGELKDHILNTYHDHRMAMAFSLFASCTQPLPIDDKAVVAKTFPNYWDTYSSLQQG
ncbi:MAG: 3-phosphoshikimate 1-carboxyvinyltransferase [Pseudomonadota bacterium]